MKKINHINKKYGKLLVLSEHSSVGKTHKTTFWNCVCDCGRTRIVPGYNFLRKVRPVKSCKVCCYEPQRKPYGKSAFKTLVRRYVESAKKRNLEYSLSEKDFVKITQSKCHYCGVLPKQEVKLHKSPNGQYLHNGIDRVNNAAGYTLENCVPCCKRCNMMKGDLSVEAFLKHIREIYVQTNSSLVHKY